MIRVLWRESCVRGLAPLSAIVPVLRFRSTTSAVNGLKTSPHRFVLLCNNFLDSFTSLYCRHIKAALKIHPSHLRKHLKQPNAAFIFSSWTTSPYFSSRSSLCLLLSLSLLLSLRWPEASLGQCNVTQGGAAALEQRCRGIRGTQGEALSLSSLSRIDSVSNREAGASRGSAPQPPAGGQALSEGERKGLALLSGRTLLSHPHSTITPQTCHMLQWAAGVACILAYCWVTAYTDNSSDWILHPRYQRENMEQADELSHSKHPAETMLVSARRWNIDKLPFCHFWNKNRNKIRNTDSSLEVGCRRSSKTSLKWTFDWLRPQPTLTVSSHIQGWGTEEKRSISDPNRKWRLAPKHFCHFKPLKKEGAWSRVFKCWCAQGSCPHLITITAAAVSLSTCLSRSYWSFKAGFKMWRQKKGHLATLSLSPSFWQISFIS